MTGQELIMAGSYDYRLVALSIFISILAAYAARALADRVNGARGKAWAAWLAGGAFANGIGIWSMHYTGMLAFSLPVPVEYDWPIVVLSLLVGIVGCGAALFRVSYLKVGRAQTVASSLFFGGVGISGLHFTAMAAMRFQGMHRHSPGLVILSIALAIMISSLALSLIFLFPENTSVWRLRTHGSAILMGAANPVMHYTAMTATTFTYSAVVPDLSHAVSIWSLGVLGNSIVPVMVLIVALISSLADRLREQKSLLNELFEETPEPVVLMNMDHTIIRINREFTRLFGYSQNEAVGRLLGDLIVPVESRDEVQNYSELSRRGQRVEAEGLRHSKHGRSVIVDIVHVPVSLPAAQSAIFAIYRDITDRKRAELEIKATTEQLRKLSASLQSAIEEERTRIARELHDELGSALTALRWGLEETSEMLSTAMREGEIRKVREKIAILTTLIDTMFETVRKISSELRPSILDDAGLVAAIEWQARQFEARTGVVCRFDSQTKPVRLSREQSTAVFRIFQEALTNVARHAQATRVDIAMKEEDGQFILTISDNGRGFTAREQSGSESLGLLGMRERAHLLGGEVRITSSEGRGTVVTVRVPIAGQKVRRMT